MHQYEILIDGEALSIEADTWRRELDTGAVIFVERSREPTSPRRVDEHELLRLRLAQPHRYIRRL